MHNKNIIFIFTEIKKLETLKIKNIKIKFTYWSLLFVGINMIINVMIYYFRDTQYTIDVFFGQLLFSFIAYYIYLWHNRYRLVKKIRSKRKEFYDQVAWIKEQEKKYNITPDYKLYAVYSDYHLIKTFGLYDYGYETNGLHTETFKEWYTKKFIHTSKVYKRKMKLKSIIVAD